MIDWDKRSSELPLHKMLTALRECIRAERNRPSRPELLDALKTVSESLSRALQALTDDRIRHFLVEDDECEADLVALRKLSARAKKALRLYPVRRGGGGLYPVHAAGPNCYQLCALMGAISYEFITRKPAGCRNPDVHNLCAYLWANAREEALCKESAEGWEYHLKSKRNFVAPAKAGIFVASWFAPAQSKARKTFVGRGDVWYAEGGSGIAETDEDVLDNSAP